MANLSEAPAPPMTYAPRHHAERSPVAARYYNYTTSQHHGNDSPISPLPKALLSQKLEDRERLARSSDWVRTQSSHSSFLDAYQTSEPPSRNSYAEGGPSSRKSSATLEASYKPKSTSGSTARSIVDVERQGRRYSHDPFRTPGPSPTSTYPTDRRRSEDEDVVEVNLNNKALQILFFLSGPATLFSFLVLLWTLLAFIIVLVLQPFRLCSKGHSISQDLVNFLSPILHKQLRLIYSSACTPTTTFSAPALLFTNLLSPFISVGVLFSAWVAAFFWVFSAILGDPGPEKTKNHNDGKASVLAVRTWWERWLCKSLR
ncbi:hypothetical protein LTS18_012233 [Coniosporium uncinatum]|uniref:Uncharacterized protein n=1 Tax=Coniosporium uncinatum TaxID=93489 RepID=A0ACC3DW20_9PEZI|nr:hypothetical protein LTS18_012233 [Coniosporium uncinatum]